MNTKLSLLLSVVLFSLCNSALVWSAGPPSSPALIEKGKTAYATNCMTCHGPKGDGMGDAGKYMQPKPRNFATDKFKNGDSPTQVFGSITKGLDGTSMVGFGSLPEEDRWGLTYYVLSFRKK